MSMAELTVLQFIGIFASYLTMTLFLPALLFHRKTSKYEFSVRFMIYFLWGNFYMMNVVFLLQLLHICNRATLILVTFLIAVLLFFHDRGIRLDEYLHQRLDLIRRYLSGVMGRKTLGRSVRKRIRGIFKLFLRWLVDNVLKKLFPCVLLFGTIAFTIYIFGSTYLINYGYNASDLVVHNYWINGLKDGKLFVAGIYPFGYHIVLYFLSEVFGIRVLTLLRLFGLVQILYVLLMLLASVSALSKSKYVTFLSGILYVGLNIWSVDSFSRFHSPLPQEYGMVFILPSVYFAIRYFQVKAEDLKSDMEKDDWKSMKLYRRWLISSRRYEAMEKRRNRTLYYTSDFRYLKFKDKVKRCIAILQCLIRRQKERHIKEMMRFRESSWMLVYFALAFQATLAVHFYATIITGIACIAIAIGFFGKFIRGEYFKVLMQTGIIAIICAVYPFAFAYIGGTPFQGSMNWALGVISGDTADSQNSEELQEELEKGLDEGDAAFYDSDGNLVAIMKKDGTVIGSESFVKQFDIQPNMDSSDSTQAEDTVESENVKTVNKSLVQKVKERLLGLAQKLRNGVITCKNSFKESIDDYVVNKDSGYKGIAKAMMVLLLASMGLSILVRCKDSDYGRMLTSISLSAGFLMLLLIAEKIGLPVLIDANRTRYFMLYFICMMFGLAVDAVLYLLLSWRKLIRPMRVVAFGLVVVTLVVTYQHKLYAKPYHVEAQETNGAILCTASILETHTKKDFTIVSANDEMQMLDASGYHTESIDLLREMEDYEEDAYFACPTKYVYIYIEKVPLDYYTSWYGSGSTVSEEGASMELPKGDGVDIYTGENRFIVMSRLYYWAEAYERMYPNEMQVFYEDDDFICYEIKQNTSALLNLAINYGFNVGEK